jgi:hypothetical protein
VNESLKNRYNNSGLHVVVLSIAGVVTDDYFTVLAPTRTSVLSSSPVFLQPS